MDVGNGTPPANGTTEAAEEAAGTAERSDGV
jgi:hypothetical protein